MHIIFQSFKNSTLYIVLGCKVGLFKPSVEFAVGVAGELARAESECVLRTEDESKWKTF